MIPKEYLEEEYIKKQRSAEDVAKDFNLSEAQTYYWLKKYNLPSNSRGGRRFTKDLIGQRFGKLIVLNQVSGDGQTACWNCKCDCGNFVVAKSNLLRRREKQGCNSCAIHKWKGYREISGTYFGGIKISAKDRNIKFSISIKYIWNLFEKQNRRCALSGILLLFARCRKLTEQTASLDRIDSSKGYIKGNVQWVHKDINKIKWNYSEEKFLKLIEQIYNFRIRKTKI